MQVDLLDLASCPRGTIMLMNPQLPPNIRQVVEERHGCTEAESDGEQLIVMTRDIYMQWLGLGTAEELDASRQELARRIESARQGQGNLPFRDVLNELGE